MHSPQYSYNFSTFTWTFVQPPHGDPTTGHVSAHPHNTDTSEQETCVLLLVCSHTVCELLFKECATRCTFTERDLGRVCACVCLAHDKAKY